VRQRLDTRLSPARVVSRFVPLIALGVLLAGCQGAERPLAPSLHGPQFSHSPESGLKGKITFHSNRDGDFEVFVMNADGTQQTQLTHNDSHEFDPAWSPNGKQILFNSFPADFSSDGEIFVMNADGTGIVQLTDNDAHDFGTTWSPSGKEIAFVSNRDGADDAYVMNADGSGVRRLTTNAYVVGVTAWSPNGKQIAFISYRDYVLFGSLGDLEIFVMNADGTGITQLTNNTVDDEGDHAGWSPNGKLFSFSSRRVGADLDIFGGDLDIFVMNADGTGVRQLTGIDGDAAEDDDSFWSPNGKQLAFHSTRDGDEEIYVMNVDGSGVTQLTFNTGFADGVPVWIGGKLRSGENGDDGDQ
jgi:Tol biopolymer transport system component